jgi:rod shape-determining protein MreD
LGGKGVGTMMKTLKYPIFFVIAFVLQSSLASLIGVMGTTPDFLLIFVVFAALRHGGLYGTFWGFIVGLTQDIYAPVEWLGASALSLCIVGFLVGQLEEKFLNLNLITKTAALGVAFFVNDALYFWSIGMEKTQISSVFLKQSLPEGMYTTLLGSLAFYFLYSHSDRRHAS